MFDFIKIGLVDAIDIFLVGLLIYQAYRLIKGTAALSIFIGIIVFYMLWIVVKALQMELLSSIMGQVIGVGVISLIILFQQEIRRFLMHIGTKYSHRGSRFKLFGAIFGERVAGMPLKVLEELTLACRRMSETRTGALIVLKGSSSMEYIADTGDRLDAIVSRRLIENIFFKNAPLHDGALIINEDKIVAARCTLPISENPSIPAHYGMRHRAALGISEQADVVVIVVSEETGDISFVKNGEIKKVNSISELRLSIERSYE